MWSRERWRENCVYKLKAVLAKYPDMEYGRKERTGIEHGGIGLLNI